jgi:hypothetical protein
MQTAQRTNTKTLGLRELNSMNRDQWFIELKSFLSPHPVLHPDAGELYTPRDRYEITFLFNGHPSISGKPNELEINFNSEEFILLSIDSPVTRILWSSLIGFELSTDFTGPNKKAKLYVVPNNKT